MARCEQAAPSATSKDVSLCFHARLDRVLYKVSGRHFPSWCIGLEAAFHALRRGVSSVATLVSECVVVVVVVVSARPTLTRIRVDSFCTRHIVRMLAL